jgi:hypothetical protein
MAAGRSTPWAAGCCAPLSLNRIEAPYADLRACVRSSKSAPAPPRPVVDPLDHQGPTPSRTPSGSGRPSKKQGRLRHCPGDIAQSRPEKPFLRPVGAQEGAKGSGDRDARSFAPGTHSRRRGGQWPGSPIGRRPIASGCGPDNYIRRCEIRRPAPG